MVQSIQRTLSTLPRMPSDSYHGPDRRDLGRRVRDLLKTERMQVSCSRCGLSRIYTWATFSAYRQDCALSWLEGDMPPRCWKGFDGQPADCVREIVWLDVSAEDVGVSDEG